MSAPADRAARRVPRVVAHVDMDAFYAAVEVLDDPSLAGVPLIIGHPGGRGVVSTCSYEARRFGVHSAMPSAIAARLCPRAVWRRGRMRRYVAVSRKIRRLLDDVSPLVEPLSIDEAFVDLSGIASDLDDGMRLAGRLRRRIRESAGLTASVGVAPNKFLAKIASDLDKPDGLTRLGVEDLPRRLWPAPIERLWGVGPRAAERLRGGGVRTIGDLLRLTPAALAVLVGERRADRLRRLARGEDERPVVARRAARSISEERTYGVDLVEPSRIDRALLARAEGVARQLRRKGLVARTVHIKIRTGDYTTWTRALTLGEPTDLTEPIVAAARRLYAERIRRRGRGLRLIGVGVSGLVPRGSVPGRLFVPDDEARARSLAEVADAVRDRLGEHAITRARLIEPRAADSPLDAPASDRDEASSLPARDG